MGQIYFWLPQTPKAARWNQQKIGRLHSHCLFQGFWGRVFPSLSILAFFKMHILSPTLDLYSALFLFVEGGGKSLFSFCFHITINKNSPHLKQHSNSEVFTSRKPTDSIQFWHNLLECTLRLEYSQTGGSISDVSCQSSVGFPMLLTQWLKHEKRFLKTCRKAAWGTWKSSAPEQQENDVSASSEATVYSNRNPRHY